MSNKRNCCKRALCEAKRLAEWNRDCVRILPTDRSEALSRCPFENDMATVRGSSILYTKRCS